MSALDQLLLKTYRESVKVHPGWSDPMGRGATSDNSPAEPASEPVEVNERTTEATATGGAEPTETRSTLRAFKPDWEVDQFRWPAICRQLTERLGARLDRAIQQLHQRCDSHCNLLLMTSQRRQAGRTTLTLCLARRAAQLGLRVAVVDLDHENPCLMSMLGVAADVGIENLCQEKETPESICITALEDGVSLLPSVKSTREAPWTSQAVLRALQVVAAHYDLVLLDAPPAEKLHNLVIRRDPSYHVGAIIVRDRRGSTDQELQELVSWLHNGNVWTAGVVENFAA